MSPKRNPLKVVSYFADCVEDWVVVVDGLDIDVDKTDFNADAISFDIGGFATAGFKSLHSTQMLMGPILILNLTRIYKLIIPLIYENHKYIA